MYQHQHLFVAAKSALQTLINVNLTNLSLYRWFMVIIPHRGEARCQTWMWHHPVPARIQSTARVCGYRPVHGSCPSSASTMSLTSLQDQKVPDTASTESEHLSAEQHKTPAMTHPRALSTHPSECQDMQPLLPKTQ